MTKPVKVVVDEESFDVVKQGNSIHFTWVSGPNTGYGFTIGRSGAIALTDGETRSAIHGFLSEVDPSTGYLAE